MKPLVFVSLFLAISGLVLYVVGFSINTWFVYNKGGLKTESGLWRTCSSITIPATQFTPAISQSRCTVIDKYGCTTNENHVKTARAFGIIFLFFSFVHVIVIALHGAANMVLIVPLQGVVVFFVALSGLIPWGIGIRLFHYNVCGGQGGGQRAAGFDIGPGLALIIAGWCSALVAGILYFIAVMKVKPQLTGGKAAAGGKAGSRLPNDQYQFQFSNQPQQVVYQQQVQYAPQYPPQQQARSGSYAPNDGYRSSSPYDGRVSPRNAPARDSREQYLVLVPRNSIPAGDWVRDHASRYFWSDNLQLYFDPESSQYFDSRSNCWYDPATRVWTRSD